MIADCGGAPSEFGLVQIWNVASHKLASAWEVSGDSLYGISFAPDWGEWQVLSLFDGIDVPLEPGMCFHVPTALREYGAFTVGSTQVTSGMLKPVLYYGATS